MTEPVRVEVDTKELVRGVRQLADGLERAVVPTAASTADGVARRLRPLVPVRTGALRSTVGTSTTGDGAEVHYGGDLPYARYIDRRTNATTTALAGADRDFADAMTGAAEREVRKL